MLNRRSFNKIVLGGAAASALAACSKPAGKSSSKARIVVLGGGFGGATCAKYLKKFNSNLEVILVEANKTYHTCPFSNMVLAGEKKLSDIAHGYDILSKKYGVKVHHTMAYKVDAANKNLVLTDGTKVPYDKIVVSPGMDFKYDMEGYNLGDEQLAPHAYKAGNQTTLLRKQLVDMPNGGTFVMVPPENPFRCPPGPYERASLIAHYLKHNKPKSKLLILDPKNKFSKMGLFTEGWDEHYSDIIEWRGSEDGGKVTQVDAKNRKVKADGEWVQADVLNYIPNQKANKIAFTSGLTKGDWCPISQTNFESRIHKDVHIIGDSSVATSMPKSGFSANSQAKVVALQIIAELNGQDLITPKYANTCYSLITPTHGISVSKVYKANDKKVGKVKGSGGLSPIDAGKDYRSMEAIYAQGWYDGITADMFT
jgi:sulfide dehydrogenase [flavocytochrome c] flavoprotein subunit